MPRIPVEEIARIKRETDLVALVRSRGIELKKHGTKDWAGRCLFHAEETASFIVSPDQGLSPKEPPHGLLVGVDDGSETVLCGRFMGLSPWQERS